MRRPALILVLATVASTAMAQHGFPASHFNPRPAGSFHPGYAGNSFARAGSIFYPLALPLDGFYAEALNAGYPVASQPPVVIVQAPLASSVATEEHPAGDPVLIELQGEHYVRLSGPATSDATTLDLQPSTPAEAGSVRWPKPYTALETLPAQRKFVVLIFRDGHREEVSDYVITNGILYARTSYYTSGAWTKNIDLATLDVLETDTYNKAQGVRFQLPNAANEVIVGP